MKNLSIPVGISDFEEIRRKGYYYVDKSMLIAKLLKDEGTKVTLITRPRRFGKTLGMSMLANFLDVRKDSRDIFEGLEIAGERELCEKWRNQCPTLFLSLKRVDGLDFQNAYGMLCSVLAELCVEHQYLLGSDRVETYDKRLFTRVMDNAATPTEIKNCLLALTRAMWAYYGKQVVLLIDEYDVPVAKSNSHGYYLEMLDVMKGLLQVLKDNQALDFAVITGCLKIAKESIFTGTNNLVSDSIMDSRFNEYFGFIQSDVDRILKDAEAENYAETMKNWYDGYHFGDFDVYCPWDVMNYLRDIQEQPGKKPASYWKNTSDNAIIRSFIDYAGNSITNKLETLLAGGYIIQKIDENLTYDYLHSSEDNLWSILYLTGYLTSVRETELSAPLAEGMTALVIPNVEIKEIFETTVSRWFDESAKKWDRKELFHAVWNGDTEGLTREMNKLLRRTISYHDYKEDFYHAFLAGIFTGAGYMVDSNKEHGEGRSDVVVYDPVNGRVAVFEAKYSKKLESLNLDCDRALKQIDQKMYSEEYEGQYDQIYGYGISFFKKRCLVKMMRNFISR